MPDREKVVKALQRDIRITERDPEMIRHVHSGRLCYFFEVKAVESAIAILKEQEPVKPVNVRWEMGINGGNCPKCMNWVQRSYNYCPFCGKAVKWDA